MGRVFIAVDLIKGLLTWSKLLVKFLKTNLNLISSYLILERTKIYAKTNRLV